jgi:DUF1365 family protein
MNNAIYHGWVRHRRYRPAKHGFRYPLFMMYLDLAELDDLFRRRWLWSARRFNLAWFRRADHLGDPSRPLDAEVRDLVEERTGERPAGPIRLLTHLRYFGYGFNPVSFYYCFTPDGASVKTVVAEVNNTPWGEQHCYVLHRRSGQPACRALDVEHPKEFHVSPFMGMNQKYRWRVSAPGASLTVHIENIETERRIFDATMRLKRRPIRASSLAGVLLRYPFMTLQVIVAIHYQALRLWLKRVPSHAHPGTIRAEESRS